jgi:hypothetical protein
MMDVTYSSKMQLTTYETTWRYIPEGSNLQIHHHENLKSQPENSSCSEIPNWNSTSHGVHENF